MLLNFTLILLLLSHIDALKLPGAAGGLQKKILTKEHSHHIKPKHYLPKKIKRQIYTNNVTTTTSTTTSDNDWFSTGIPDYSSDASSIDSGNANLQTSAGDFTTSVFIPTTTTSIADVQSSDLPVESNSDVEVQSSDSPELPDLPVITSTSTTPVIQPVISTSSSDSPIEPVISTTSTSDLPFAPVISTTSDSPIAPVITTSDSPIAPPPIPTTTTNVPLSDIEQQPSSVESEPQSSADVELPQSSDDTPPKSIYSPPVSDQQPLTPQPILTTTSQPQIDFGASTTASDLTKRSSSSFWGSSSSWFSKFGGGGGGKTSSSPSSWWSSKGSDATPDFPPSPLTSADSAILSDIDSAFSGILTQFSSIQPVTFTTTPPITAAPTTAPVASTPDAAISSVPVDASVDGESQPAIPATTTAPVQPAAINSVPLVQPVDTTSTSTSPVAPIVAVSSSAPPIAPIPTTSAPAVAPVPTTSAPVAPIPTTTEPVAPIPTTTEPVAPIPTTSAPVAPIPTTTEPVAPIPTTSAPVASAPVAAPAPASSEAPVAPVVTTSLPPPLITVSTSTSPLVPPVVDSSEPAAPLSTTTTAPLVPPVVESSGAADIPVVTTTTGPLPADTVTTTGPLPAPPTVTTTGPAPLLTTTTTGPLVNPSGVSSDVEVNPESSAATTLPLGIISSNPIVGILSTTTTGTFPPLITTTTGPVVPPATTTSPLIVSGDDEADQSSTEIAPSAPQSAPLISTTTGTWSPLTTTGILTTPLVAPLSTTTSIPTGPAVVVSPGDQSSTTELPISGEPSGIVNDASTTTTPLVSGISSGQVVIGLPSTTGTWSPLTVVSTTTSGTGLPIGAIQSGTTSILTGSVSGVISGSISSTPLVTTDSLGNIITLSAPTSSGSIPGDKPLTGSLSLTTSSPGAVDPAVSGTLKTGVTNPSTTLTQAPGPPATSTSSNWLPANIITQAVPTETNSPDQAPSAVSQSSIPTVLPSTLPKAIGPSDNTNQPSTSSTLIQIGFDYSLNYPFVAANPIAAAQIFQYLPEGLAYGLQIDVSQIVMQSLQPYESQNAGYIVTVALAYIPNNLVSTLDALIHTPTSRLYMDNEDESVSSLVKLIDPSIPLIPGSQQSVIGGTNPQGSNGEGSNPSNTASGSSPSETPNWTTAGGETPDSGTQGSIDQSVPKENPTVNTKTVGIAVGAIAGALAYGGAIFLVSKKYRKKNRLEIVSSGGSARLSPMIGVPYYYDDVSSGSSTRSTDFSSGSGSRPSRGSGGRFANGVDGILPIGRHISEPVMSENSLGWA